MSQLTTNDILTIVLGSGALISLITTFITWFKESLVSARALDLQRRELALDYYKPLYGHIAVLVEYAKAYCRCNPDESESVFVFNGNKSYFGELPQDEILELFKKSYTQFSSFYIEKKSEGYEIFITEKLEENLITFWKIAISFNENPQEMKNAEKINEFDQRADKTHKFMKKLFGLKS
ncbi:MAG: hypothetical protein ACFFCW_33210 [Candidatus Hodarchaeota archaeon]